MGILILYIALSGVAGYITHSKGRSEPDFFLLSLFLSPVVGLKANLSDAWDPTNLILSFT